MDYIATYSKMWRFCWPGERSIVLLTSGSLATSQAVVNAIKRDLENPEAKFRLDHYKDAMNHLGFAEKKFPDYCVFFPLRH